MFSIPLTYLPTYPPIYLPRYHALKLGSRKTSAKIFLWAKVSFGSGDFFIFTFLCSLTLDDDAPHST